MRRPLLAVCLCLVILTALRIKWSGSYAASEDSGILAIADKEPVTVTGRVYRKEEKTIYLKNISIQTSAAIPQQAIPFTENMICEWEGEREIPLGSTVLLKGIFRQFSGASNPGEFDREAYYRTLKIGGMLTDTVLLGNGREYSLPKEALYRLKLYWKERLYRIFPEKEASIMSTMLLGEKTELDGEIKALYKRNGIIHILSISGLHITMIGMGIYRLLRRLGIPRWLAAILGGGILVLYGILTGLGVSVCRAVGMYLIRMLGEVWGRTYDMLTALGIAGALTVCFHPLYLCHAGFLLSYGAVLGIGILYPALLPEEKRFLPQRFESNPWRARFGKWARRAKTVLKESICAGVSITAATLPILLWFYYETPVYSVLLNQLVLPFMQPTVLAGMLAMLVPGLGWLGNIDRAILAGYESLCRLCENLPFHTWNPGKPEMWQIVLYYIMLAAFIILLQFDWLRKKYPARVLWLSAAVAVLSLQALPENKITFLDVGQGDCICIQTASGKNYLFDCGSSSRSRVGQYVLIPFLKHEGISRLDAVFVSHPDADHCNGVEELLASAKENGITVDRLVLPDIAEGRKEEEFEGMLETVLKMSQPTLQSGQRTAVQYIKAGDSFGDKSVYAACLHPPGGYFAESNSYSECFYVEFGGNAAAGKASLSLLLTGDVEGEGEELLLAQLEEKGIKDITVLKTAHHGSRNSTKEEVLAQLQPRLAVISCGRENGYGHPHGELLERLEQTGAMTLQTPLTGAVEITWTGKKIQVRTYRKQALSRNIGNNTIE